MRVPVKYMLLSSIRSLRERKVGDVVSVSCGGALWVFVDGVGDVGDGS